MTLLCLRFSSLDAKEDEFGLDEEERNKRGNLKLQLASFLKDEKMFRDRNQGKNGWKGG